MIVEKLIQTNRYYQLLFFSTSRGPATLATFVAVYALFGPTYPGIFDKDRCIYTLFYPVMHQCWSLFWFYYSTFMYSGFIIFLGLYRGFPLHFLFRVSLQTAVMMGEVYHHQFDKFQFFLFSYVNFVSFHHESGIAVGVSRWDNPSYMPCFYLW